MLRRKTQVWLLEASPRNPSTGATVTVRLAGGGVHPYRYFGAQWLAGLDRPPIASSRLGYGEGGDDGEAPGWGTDSAAQAMQLVWAGGARLDEIAGHYWRGAAFTLRGGPDGGADGDFAARLTGKIRDAKIDLSGILALDLADPTAALAVPALPGVFAGTGDAEGPVDLKDRPKRRAFGDVRNVELWPLDQANNIWVATDPARPLQGIPAVYDRGNAGTAGATIAWAGSVAATLSALAASSPPDGGFTRAPSIGCIKWWHPSPGLLTADLLGEIGAGYVSTAPEIAERIVASRTAVTFVTGAVAAWAAARPGTANILLDNPAETVSQVLWRLLGPITLWWHLDADGKIALGEWAWGASAGALSGGRIERRRTFRPTKKRILGYRRNHRQMARGDIAAALLIGDIEGAGATSSANLFRVETDGIESSAAGTGSPQLLTFAAAIGIGLRTIDFDDVGIAVGDSFSISAEIRHDVTGQTLFLRAVMTDGSYASLDTRDSANVATDPSMDYVTAKRETIVRASGWQKMYLQVRTSGGAGTLRIRRGMINKGPIAAPYAAPTRGATHGATWDQVTGAGKPEDGATRNGYAGVHNSANTYDKGDIVILGDGTKSYIAKQNVPASTLITNTAYWGLLVEGSGGAAGEAGYSAILSNQSHVVATVSDGSGGDYSDAGGQMSIYEGSTNRTGSATFAKVGSGTWYSINSAGVYTISDPGTDDATCQFDATYGSVTLRLTYSISKSKGGITAKVVKVTQTREVITYDGKGALSPSTQTTTFNAVLQNSSATVNWSATDLAGNAISPVTNLLSAATGASVTMTAANFDTRRGATNGVVITASISDGGTHSDVVSVIKVQDGADGAAQNLLSADAGPEHNAALSYYQYAGFTMAQRMPISALGWVAGVTRVSFGGLVRLGASGADELHYRLVCYDAPTGGTNLGAILTDVSSATTETLVKAENRLIPAGTTHVEFRGTFGTPPGASQDHFYRQARLHIGPKLPEFSEPPLRVGRGEAELGATAGADWSTNVTGRPTELTDGRVLAGLNVDGTVKAGKVGYTALAGDLLQEIVSATAANITATDVGTVMLSLEDVTVKPSQGGYVHLILTSAVKLAPVSDPNGRSVIYARLQRSPANAGTWTEVQSWLLGANRCPTYVDDGLGAAVTNYEITVAAAAQYVDVPPTDGDYDYRWLASKTSDGTGSTPASTSAGVAETAQALAISVKVAA